MKKKKVWYPAAALVAAVLAAVYIFFPRPASDLIIEFTFQEISGDSLRLYYTTDTQPVYSDEQSIVCDIDYETMQASFRLDGSLEGHLTGLRLDFPVEEQLLSIRHVTISSAAVIQKDFNPCIYFNEVVATNDLELSLADASNIVYVLTGSTDPYLIFSDSLVEQITGYYSHQTVSRLLVCIFIAGCCVLSRRRIFADDTVLKQQKAETVIQSI
ncbi:MAG: hypothetical protein LUI10_09065 [Lachnospiraceae bacterium]|nr:hypothetical protein [Lachnospiraceae bacterium]